MNIVCSDIFNCPVVEDTVLTVREAGVFPRTFTLRNLTAGTPAYRIQESADGGTTWSNLTLEDGTAQTTLGVAGGGTDATVERVISANILRVRVSGGGADRDMEITLNRVYDDNAHLWTSPLL